MKIVRVLLSTLILLLFGCTSDRAIPSNAVIVNPQAVLVHYFNFNDLPAGNLDVVTSDFSETTNKATLTYDGNGLGYMDTFTPGYLLNARNNDAGGLGLRARNPSDTRNLVLNLPTVGFKKPIVQFATARSGSGATTQNYSYSVDGNNFITAGLKVLSFNPNQDPLNDLVALDFSEIVEANNNVNFKIKISFSGATAAGATGNNRFDNITLEALPLTFNAPPTLLSYNSPNSFTINILITPLNPTVTGEVVTYTTTPNLPTGLILNATTGEISGTPTEITQATDYTITATNAFGNTNFVLNIAVTAIPTVVLMHYWNFNSLPAGTLTSINADYSLLNASATYITYNGAGTGYMDQFTPSTSLNAQNGDVSGLGLRARNPSDTKNLDVKFPTTGFKNIVMKFATAKSGSGATVQNYSYSLDGINYSSSNLAVNTFNPNADPAFDIVTLDFSSIAGINNNPNFVVRINFAGTSASGTSGNNRFDNITVQGNQL
jgi:hypothetical protein